MATISLRAYNREIEGLIDSGHIDEAVSHCRHILQSFPKHIATYRLLGKAFLESQRYTDAADIFQRVLSAVPDDFVAHVGMSIIREDEGNIETAIWHMERAFETQPANAAIQEELRRLYGRRDGLEPPKVRLTRGALARMYARGNLYDQAVGELRAALSEDPQRPDLQVLLAQMYALSGKTVETINTCSHLIRKFPYNMEANRLLSVSLLETERAGDMEIYHNRLLALDPYYAEASPQELTSDDILDNAIIVEKLVWRSGVEQVEAPSQPAWASSLGIAFEEASKEALPEWLSVEDKTPSPTVEGAPASVSPFTELPSDLFAPESEEEIHPEVPAEEEDMVPDWMKEAGWEPSSGEAREEPSPLAFEEISEEPEGEIARADLPDWIKEIAPEGALEEKEPSASEIEEAEADILPWLQETPPSASDSIITWLKEEKEEVISHLTPEASQVDAGVDESADIEIPDWLGGLEGEAEPFEEPPAEVTPDEGLPSWLQETEEEATPAEGIPDWLAEMGEEETVQPEAEFEAKAVETTLDEGLPEWLQERGEEASAGEVPEWLAEMGEEVPPQVKPEVPSIEKAPEEEPPEWLQEAEEEVAPSEEIPEWLIEVGEEAPAQTVPTETPILEVTPPDEELPEWLRETETEADQATGVTGWLEGLGTEAPTPEEAPEPVQLIKETTPEEEIPEWLTEMGEEAPIPTEPEAPAVEAALEEGPPEWLDEADEVTPVQIEPIEIELPVSEVPPTTVAEPPGIDLEDQDAALAWLESLAAHQGAIEEELITKPEERLETPPEWVKQSAEAEEAEAALPVEGAQPEAPEWLQDIEEETPPEEEIPEWLAETVEETPLRAEPEISPIEAAPEEGPPEWLEEVEEEAIPADEIPEWLVEAGEEIPADIAPTEVPTPEVAPEFEPVEVTDTTPPTEAESPAGIDLEDQDAALAWLESLAAQHGAVEEELITKPEDRLSTPPEWVKQASEEVETPVVVEPHIEETAPPPPIEVEAEAPEWLPEVEEEPAPIEEIPEWLAEESEEAPYQAEPEVTPVEAPPQEELPEWLLEAEEEAAQPTGVTGWLAGLGEETPAEDLAEWIGEISVEAPPEGAPAEVPGIEATLKPQVDQPPGADMSDQDAALAWLESLAIQHGAAEEELITKPEERLESPPEWVKQAAEVEEIPSEPTRITEEAEPTPTITTEEQVLKWLPEAEEAEAIPTIEEDIFPEGLGVSELEVEEAVLTPDFVEAEIEILEEPVEPEEVTPKQEPEISEWVPEAIVEEEEIKEEIKIEEVPAAMPEAIEAELEPTPIEETPTEVAQIPKLDINTASLADLEELPGIGFILAQSIIAYREAFGPFDRIEELDRVAGIGPALINELRGLIIVEPIEKKPILKKTAPLTLHGAEEALEEARSAIEEGDIPKAIERYTKVLRKGFHLEAIILDLREVLIHYPEEVGVWQALGDAYMRNDQLSEALDAYIQAEKQLR